MPSSLGRKLTEVSQGEGFVKRELWDKNPS